MSQKKFIIPLLLFFQLASVSCFNKREKLPAPAEYSSCTDGIKNGEETDVDCGGACAACYTPPSCSVTKNRYSILNYRSETQGFLRPDDCRFNDGLFRITSYDASYGDTWEVAFVRFPQKSGNYSISTSAPTEKSVQVSLNSYRYTDFIAQSGTVHVLVSDNIVTIQFCSIPVKSPDNSQTTASAHFEINCDL